MPKIIQISTVCVDPVKGIIVIYGLCDKGQLYYWGLKEIDTFDWLPVKHE